VVRYNAQNDPLCYPGTRVLRNKAEIRSLDELEQFEQLMFDSRAEEDLPAGTLDFAHYRAIHRHFFQDVYDWAGEIRTIRTGKGANWFCFPEYIEKEAAGLFRQLADKDHLRACSNKLDFAQEAAWFLSELNAIHPFREGNGRVQLVFLTMLARNAGFGLDERKLQPEAFLAAMIGSFDGDLAPLANQIEALL